MAAAAAVHAQSVSEAPDLDAYRRIRDEGMLRSQVMALASELIDGIGPRLTGSPNLAKAVAWSQQRLRLMGLATVRTDSWGVFGVGWRQWRAWLRLVEPDTAPFIASRGAMVAGDAGRDHRRGRCHSRLHQRRGVRGAQGQAAGQNRAAWPRCEAARDVPDSTSLWRNWSDDAQLADLSRPETRAADEPNVEGLFAATQFLERSCHLLAAEGVRY